MAFQRATQRRREPRRALSAPRVNFPSRPFVLAVGGVEDESYADALLFSGHGGRRSWPDAAAGATRAMGLRTARRGLKLSHFAKLRPVPDATSTRPLRILVVGAGVGGISIARGLLRDGHDVTVFERRPDVQAGGGAVTIWSNGSTVLGQLGVDMDGAGQSLSTLQVVTATGRPVTTVDLTAIVDRLGAPVRMVPRRGPAGTAAGRLSVRTHPVQCPCDRGRRHGRRSFARV